MTITGFGISCFRIESKGLNILFDPPRVGVRPPRAHPDILLITHDHPDHANFGLCGSETFVIANPGEYEVSGIRISGIATFHDKEGGRKLGRNTVFKLELENLTICHLGDLASKKTAGAQGETGSSVEELLRPCDIMLVPCGGKTVLGPGEAAELVRTIQPKIVIPMHADSFTPFAKALGVKLEIEEKIAIRPADLPKSGLRLVAVTPTK